MKSHKQHQAELKAKRARKALKQSPGERRTPIPKTAVPCNPSLFAPDNSYSTPRFVERGYYVDLPFECEDCGKAEIWTAAQQKWWYEVAKGSRWTTARRCRNCRRKERERKNEARRIHLEGLGRKAKTSATTGKSAT